MLGVNPLIIICRHLFAIGLLLGISICLVGCDQKKMAPPAFPPPVVSVTKPVLYTVQNYHEYNGNLDAIETVHIQARVKGFLNEIAFTEGEEVKKGALLFKIDPREHSAAVKRTEADLRKATTEFDVSIRGRSWQ